MSLRIGIVGCAGTGKSSLARSLAARLNKKLLESKTVTQDILERDGYDYGSGVQVERFLANTGRQNEILRRTMEMEDEAGEFVSDRTVVDLAAYVVAELNDTDTKGLSYIFETCKNRVKTYSHLFLCPWHHDKPVQDNDKRTLNPWYQFQIHALEVGIMVSWGIPFTVVHPEGTEERVEAIVDALSR